MEAQLKPIIINLVAAIVGALGQYFYKIGSKKMNGFPFVNIEIVLGAILFTLVMVLFIWAYKLGGNISITYPVYSLTFLIGIAIGIFVEKEPWHYVQFIGSALIIAGIVLVVQFAPRV